MNVILIIGNIYLHGRLSSDNDIKPCSTLTIFTWSHYCISVCHISLLFSIILLFVMLIIILTVHLLAALNELEHVLILTEYHHSALLRFLRLIKSVDVGTTHLKVDAALIRILVSFFPVDDSQSF